MSLNFRDFQLAGWHWKRFRIDRERALPRRFIVFFCGTGKRSPKCKITLLTAPSFKNNDPVPGTV
jgi:hypothetical protein